MPHDHDGEGNRREAVDQRDGREHGPSVDVDQGDAARDEDDQ
jgi:hypothetical protein